MNLYRNIECEYSHKNKVKYDSRWLCKWKERTLNGHGLCARDTWFYLTKEKYRDLVKKEKSIEK